MSELSVIHRLLDLMIGEKRRPEALGGQDETTRTLHADMQALPEKIAQSLHGSTNGVGGATNKPIALGGGDLPVKPEAPGILEALGDMNVPFVKEFMTGQARLKKLGAAWKSWRTGPEPGVLPDSMDQVKVLGNGEPPPPDAAGPDVPSRPLSQPGAAGPDVPLQPLSPPFMRGRRGLPAGQIPPSPPITPDRVEFKGLFQHPAFDITAPPQVPEGATPERMAELHALDTSQSPESKKLARKLRLAEVRQQSFERSMAAHKASKLNASENPVETEGLFDKPGDLLPARPFYHLQTSPEATHSLGASPLPEASTGTARNTENKEQQEEMVEALKESAKVTGELNESIKELIREKGQQGHAGINQQQGVLPVNRGADLAAANTNRGVEAAMKAASVFGEVPVVP